MTLAACAGKTSGTVMDSSTPVPESLAASVSEASPREALVPAPASEPTPSLVSDTEDAATPTSATQELKPIDWRLRIPVKMMEKSREGEWVSPPIEAPFPFDELIYSWSTPLPEGCAFRLYLKVEFEPGDATDWLYGGFWGPVKDPVTEREKPTFDRGQVDMDWLKLKTKAVAYQFKIVDAGATPLERPPSLSAVATDNHPTPELFERFRLPEPETAAPGRVFDLPLRRQVDSRGERMKDRCQSAALASAMEYFGKSVNLEDIVAYIHDPEYNYPGLWPRVVGAAGEFGFSGYVDRFRDWHYVRSVLAQNKIILCSIRMKEGDCKSPPYPKMGNHIVALCGVTDDGRAVVTDSALGQSGRGYLCQWLQEDFETVWMKTKGGVAMVIAPPKGATENVVGNLPPFPADRQFVAGDDR